MQKIRKETMKNILILCNTYYQFIFAINLKLTNYPNDKVILILSDHSRNASMIAERTEREKIFEKIIFLKSKSLDQGKHTAREGFSFILKCLVHSYPEIQNKLGKITFNEFYYYNLYPSAIATYEAIKTKNKLIKCNRFEEGVLSYNTSFFGNNAIPLPKRVNQVINIEKILHIHNIVDSTKSFYCFYPELYFGHLRTVKVPLINTEENQVSHIISRVFNTSADSEQFKEKYIYFASVGDFEGDERVGELELAQKIAELVGKDNLLIKIHPRDNTNEFLNAGLNVFPFSSVPWESVQLNIDFSNHVFLTATSGSVLSVNMMLNKRPKVYFMFNLCNARNNNIVKRSVLSIENLLNFGIGNLDNIYIANSINEIISD